MAASAAHTRKRQYQPSNQTRLPSFFDNNSNTLLQRSPSMSPQVPPDVAAGLLSVGMRVRKSVPEGYRNKAIEESGILFPSSALPASSAPARSISSSMQTRELTPFCGLHKTGGWAAQELPLSSAPANMQTDPDATKFEDMPGLSMSQNTITSSQSPWTPSSRGGSASRKRTYEEESEAYMDDLFDGLDSGTVVSQQFPHERPMARMKASVSSQKMSVSNETYIFGSGDFEEATFLVPLEAGMDMDQ